ncbi:MAG: transposase [Methanosarcinales archaeon]
MDRTVVLELEGCDQAPGLKQKCWAHLLRDAKDIAEKEKPPPDTPDFYNGIKQIFQYAKETEKQINQKNRASEYAAFVEILDSFTTIDWNHHDVKRLAKRALKYKHELFTFVLIPGIEPTNNRAERALRPCVVQRKIWGGHRTDEGAKNRDILMSIIGSSKLQKKNFFNYGKEYILNALT